MASATTTADDFAGGTEVPSNWMKFEKVGDAIKGTMLGHKTVPSTNPTFKDQEVYEIRKADGSVHSVGISVTKSGTISRLNSVSVGDIVGILFEKEVPSKEKGFHPSKQLKVVTFGKDPNYADAFDKI